MKARIGWNLQHSPIMERPQIIDRTCVVCNVLHRAALTVRKPCSPLAARKQDHELYETPVETFKSLQITPLKELDVLEFAHLPVSHRLLRTYVPNFDTKCPVILVP